MRFIFVASLMISSFLGVSQDWKGYYDQAVADYRAERYAEAITNAEKALEVSKNLDLKNQAFSLQLLTTICVEAQEYKKGLTFSISEVNTFAQIEGKKSKHYAEALFKRAEMNQALANWPDAKGDYEEVSLLYAESPGRGSIEYLKTQNNYGQVLIGLADYNKAADVLRTCVDGLKQFPDEGEEYLYALYYAAFADNKSKNVQSAEARLKEFLMLAEKNGLQSWPEYAQAKTQLIQLADAKGNTAETLSLVQQGGASEEQKARQYLKAAIEAEGSQPVEAMRYFKLAEESLITVGLESNTGFSIELDYAQFLFANGQIPESEKRLIQARQIAQKLYAPASVELGFVLELEAEMQMFFGDVKIADEKYSLAFQNFSALPAPNQAAHKANAAAKFLNANRSDLARKSLEAVATDYALLFSLPEKNQLAVSSLYSETLLQLNLPELAVNHLTRHITNSTSSLVQNTLAIKLAEVYKSSGNWKKSESQLESVLQTSTAPPLLLAEAIYQMARLHQQMGKYKESETNYLAAIDRYKKLQSPELRQVYNSFATFYMTLGNYGAAEKLYLDLLRDQQTSQVLAIAVKLNLAAIYQQTLRYDEAERYLKEVLESDRKTIGESHPDFAISLQNLAALYQAMGKFEDAKKLYVKALEVDNLNGGNQTLTYANKMANLGTVYQETGEPQKALMMLESALKIREKLLGKEHPDYMFTLYNLASLQEGQGNYTAAAPLYKQVSTFYLKQVKELFPAMSDYEKTAYFNKINKIISDYEEFVILHQPTDNVAIGELFNFRLETKAMLLNASTKVRNTILNSGNQELLGKFTEWLQLKEKLARIASLTLEEKMSQQKTIDQYQANANELEKWLSSQSELFSGEFSKQAITWQDVMKALQPGEAAIEMIRLTPAKDSVIYAALVVKPDQPAPSLLVIKQGRRMEGRDFSFYSNTMRFSIENRNSFELYWAPFEPFLKAVTTVYFSADGVYNKINPLTLFDRQNNQYLVDRMTVRLLSNLRELLQVPGAVSSAPSASLFGFPDFRSGESPVVAANASASTLTRHTSASEIVRNGVADLPGTRDEVTGIEQLLKKNKWNVTAYLNKEASEEKIKGIASPDILHVATHGFFIPEKENEKTVVYSKDISLASDNPLTRSGLLLAGVEKNMKAGAIRQPDEEDGILTALEVMNLNLDHTDLVVLSACETGSGEIRNGEGVYGLQRAFLVSGANNLIMSLWKVSDEATQELMIGFYSQLLTTKDKVKAFRLAQLELKKKYESPYYWGAFVLIGR